MAERPRDAGVWEPLRALKRRLKTAQNHRHYVGNGNESLRLDQVIAERPPEGGLAAYLRDLDES